MPGSLDRKVNQSMAVKFQDYYELLGVKRDASQDEIQRAYRKLARQYHPDLNKEKSAEAKFKAIGEAYEVLKEPEKRKKYDQLGADWKNGQDFTPPPEWDNYQFRTGGQQGRPGAQGHPGDFSDFFEAFFGGGMNGGPGMGGMGGGRRQARPRPGQTHEATITIPLTDAYHGGSRSVSLDVNEPQPDGTQKRSTKTYDVKIPKGATHGTAIRLSGQGGPGLAGGPAGDLILRLNLAAHPQFKVDGHNLTAELPLTAWEAALGTKVDFQTLDGSVTLTIPAGAQSGQKLRLRDKGLPKRDKTLGDLIVQLKIVVPKTLDDDEKKLYEQLRDQSKFKPRE